MLILLALAVQPAFAQTTNLEPIQEISDKYMTGYWDEHSLHSMKAMTKLRLETAAQNKQKAPANLCLTLRDQISTETFDYCQQGIASNTAIKRATLLLKAAYISDNQQLANYAVAVARISMTDALVQDLVNQIQKGN